MAAERARGPRGRALNEAQQSRWAARPTGLRPRGPRRFLTALTATALTVVILLTALLVGGCTPSDDTPTTENGTTSSVGGGNGAETTDGDGTGTTDGPQTSTTGGRSTGVETETRRLAPKEGAFSTCPDCHAYLDVPGQVPATLMENFSHVNHLERGATCESCHEPPVHTEAGIRRPTMARCFTCHSQAENAAAPGDCEYCHPADFPRIPPSHTQAFFQGGHPQVVELQGPDDCLICHEGTEDSFCEDCHGFEIPHPTGWAKNESGEPGEHVNGAYEQGEACARCHDNRVEPPGNCYGGECHGS